MPAKLSAGLLLYRRDPEGRLEVLLGHMGGPLWARKDAAAWSIPKGEYPDGDDPFAAAQREFEEELGSAPPDVAYVELGRLAQSTAKVVTVWAGEADFDAAAAVSNTFQMQWPPRSGRWQSFPEIDRAEWVPVDDARDKLVSGQRPFLDRLLALLAGR